MDYSKLSDAEIAQKVWKYWSANVDHDDYICAAHDGWILYVKDDRWVPFDPCNNPADAWPIIVANRIGILPASNGDKWAAHYQEWRVAVADENPLRAGMIVYLMMQGDEQ